MKNRNYLHIGTQFIFVTITTTVVFLGVAMMTITEPAEAQEPVIMLDFTEETIVPNQYIIKYKDEGLPDVIEEQVAERAERNQTILGKISLFGENLTTTLRGQDTPEDKLEEIQNIRSDIGQIVEQEAPAVENTRIIETRGLEDTEDTLRRLAELDVEYVQPVRLLYLHAVPNDSEYNKLWGMEKIDAPAAWDTSTGSSNVLVGIIDSGVSENHPDLQANVLSLTRVGDNCGTGGDANGHGTHVAGTIGAVGNNAQGVAGVNWTVGIHGYCVASSQGISDTHILSAIDSAKSKGVKVINMSLGGPDSSPALEDAFKNAPNITFVVSAGNCGRGAGSPQCKNGSDSNKYFPAKYASSLDNVIAVAATGPNNEWATYSSYGSNVTVTAPGGNPSNGSSSCRPDSSDCIYSTWPGSQFENLAGTSMSAPHVTGVVAMMYSVNPNLTPAQVKQILSDTAIDLGPSGRDDKFGYGIVNLPAALAASGGGSQPSQTPVPTGNTDISTTPPPPASITVAPTQPQTTQVPTPIIAPGQHPCPSQAASGDYDCNGTVEQKDYINWTLDFQVTTSPLAPYFENIRQALKK